MSKTKRVSSSSNERRMRPALDPEAQENKMIALAVSLAEKQLREGTASSQVIAHYLKLGSTKASLEKAKLETEVKLAQAKTEQIKATQTTAKMFEDAIAAMKQYSGHGDDDDEEFE